MIGAALAVTASGLAIFVAPGAVLLGAARIPVARGERLAFWFAASLVLLTAAFAVCVALGLGIGAAGAAICLVTLLGAAASRAVVARQDDEPPVHTAATGDPGFVAPGAGEARLFSAGVLFVLVAAAVVAAVVFAPVGSVDRWWYLAYVRRYLDAVTLGTAEPFLGTGQTFARFGLHPWLFGLAAWSRVTGVDPVTIYERAAPVLVVLASVSAATAFATAIFGRGSRARLGVIATMLLWSGAMVPVLARAGEDKVMAASALLPLCLVALLRVVRGEDPGETRDAARPRVADLLLLFVAAAATAAVHALAYAFVLVALVPACVAIAALLPPRRRAIAAALAVLFVVALAPAATGVVVRERLSEIGASLSEPDHPVVRVHEGRDRLVPLPVAGYVVSPRLLVHPLALLAFAGLPLLLSRARRSQRRSGASTTATVAGALSTDVAAAALLAVTMAVPLALAFVPPLPALAGAVIPPWMVYRVLWLLPLAPLAAAAADELASRFAMRELAATFVLLALGVPVVALGARDRLAEVRENLAAPSDPAFRRLTDAVAALPPAALVVAAPELAERLPAFTARAMAATLDRSTIVFSGSRERGEARLRARAALLAGDDDAGLLATRAEIVPTHAVFDPREPLQPRCGAVLERSESWALCELSPWIAAGVEAAPLAVVEPKESWPVAAEAACGKAAGASHRDPWRAAAPVSICRFRLPPSAATRGDLVLRIDAVTGRAVDELRVAVFPADGAHARTTAGSRGYRATARVSGNAKLAFRVPALDAAELEVRIESSFLPLSRVKHARLVAAGDATVTR